MFKEFNVEFQDVEMIGGADNLLENTKVTKVVMSGDNKMSSLDSAFKNCSELDRIQGGLDLNGISDIDNVLEGNTLIKNIELKNINNENMSVNNPFPNVNEIGLGGDIYNKKALQNVIASKEWTFDNITYSDVVGDNVIIKEVNVVNDNKLVIKDTLEQKAKEIEIKGQTYENLIQSKGEYNLTDTYSATWTESNNSIENPPSMIEIPEIWGNTIQGYANAISSHTIKTSLNGINGRTVTVNSNGSFKFSHYNLDVDESRIFIEYADRFIQLKSNTTYSICLYDSSYNYYSGNLGLGFIKSDGSTAILNTTWKSSSCYAFTTDSTGKIFIFPWGCANKDLFVRIVEGEIDLSKYKYNEYDLNYIQSVGDLYVDEGGEPILDDEGNEQYRLDITSFGVNLWDGKSALLGRMSKGVLEFNGMWTENERVLDNEYGIGWTVKGSAMRGLTLDNILVEGNKPLYISFDYSHSKEVSIGSNNLWVSCFTRNGSYKNTVEGNMLYNSNGRVALITEKELDSDIGSVKICYFHSYHNENRSNDFTMKNIFVTQQSEDYVTFKPQQSNKTTILLPQPLRRVPKAEGGYVYDKLYWDNESSKYFIEKVVGKQVVNLNNLEFSSNRHTFITAGANTNLFKLLMNIDDIPSDFVKVDFTNRIKSYCICDKAKGYDDYTIHWNKDEVCCAYNYSTNSLSGHAFIVWRVPKEYDNVEKSINYLKSLGDITFYVMAVPEIIETKILEKPTLETYSPKTYISANSEVQPSQMSINNKETIFIPKFLDSNKKYTVKFNLAKKGSNTVKVKLGGIEKDAPSALGENSVEITTSQIIDKKELVLNGNGNIVTDVFVIADNMNTGELQEDGTYKIDINTTNNINHYSISIIANNSLAKGDKLYWNKSNRRYEIDRNGVIEVPTVEGNVVDLPRLYQREDTNLTVESGNIKPSEVKIEYLDIN